MPTMYDVILNAANEQEAYNQGLNMQAVWFGGTLFVFGIISVISAVIRSAGRRRESERDYSSYTFYTPSSSSNPVDNFIRQSISDNENPNTIQFHEMELSLTSNGDSYIAVTTVPSRLHFNGQELGNVPLRNMFGIGRQIIVAKTEGWHWQFIVEFPETIPSIGTKILSMGTKIFDKTYEAKKVNNLVLPKTLTENDTTPTPNRNPKDSSFIEEIERLSALKDKGHLTEEEFQQAKAKVLGS